VEEVVFGAGVLPEGVEFCEEVVGGFVAGLGLSGVWDRRGVEVLEKGRGRQS